MKKNTKLAMVLAHVDKLHKRLAKIGARFEGELVEYLTDKDETLIVEGGLIVGASVQIKGIDEADDVIAPNGIYIIPLEETTITVVDGDITEAIKTEVVDGGILELSDVDSFTDILDKLYQAIWDITDRYEAMVARIGLIEDVNKSEGVVLVELQQAVSKLAKAPATRSASERTPHVAKLQANARLTSTQQLREAHELMRKDE